MPKEIGPALPPGFHSEGNNSHNSEEAEEEESNTIGPALPPGFRTEENNSHRSEEAEEEESNAIGPALPPGFHTQGNDKNDDRNNNSNSNSDEDDSDDFIGPRPPGESSAADEESAKSLFEFKCRMTEKRRHEAESGGSARPEWMTKVPRDRTAVYGTGARSFRMTSAPQVDSSWEEQGGHVGKHRRDKEATCTHQGPPPPKAQRLETAASAATTRARQKSLLEEHMERLKKGTAKTMDDEPPPGYWNGSSNSSAGANGNAYFDRERDFAVTQVDPTRLSKTLESVGRLADSFSSAGKSNKFM